jgi:beta-ribofuranosylaminobenzene 5'-phosphate synthase
VQGGAFAPGATDALVRRLAAAAAAGVGQSSWGPAVYAIVEGEEAGGALAERARAALAELGARGAVFEGPFALTGARVTRAPVSAARN